VDRRFCIFVSAGDRHAIDSWLGEESARGWDLIVAYYGDRGDEFARLAAIATRAFRTKGGKFQNLRRVLALAPDILDAYDYVWICDDDMVIQPKQIETMFHVAKQFEFWVCQPALSPLGRVSYEITLARRTAPIRIVNFVEVAYPLFRRDKLLEFMAVYDGSLTGYGIDWWFCNVLGAGATSRFAILDTVQVTNPHHAAKPGGNREIDRLQPTPERKAAWEALRDRKGLKEYQPRTLWYCLLAD
jgi:Protein of unknown function (DUF707)